MLAFLIKRTANLESMATEQIFFNFPSLNDLNIKKEEQKNSRVYRTNKYLKSIAKQAEKSQLAFGFDAAIELNIEEEPSDLDLNLNLDISIEAEEKISCTSNINLISETDLDINKEEIQFSKKQKNNVVKQKSTHLSFHERTNDNSLLAYITDMRNSDTVKDILSAEEEVEYFKRIEQGDNEARKEFAKHNLRLVVSVAKNFFSRKNFFAEGDIIQEGNIGLMNAISKFDYRKGAKFSTYAVFWIEQSIRRAFEDKESSIRVPNYRQSQLNKINKYKKQYVQEYNREPSVTEIAKETQMKEFSVEKALSYNTITVSLNVSGDEEDGNEMIDTLSDSFNLEEHIVNKERIRAVQKGLNTLDEDEKEIILMKYYENYKLSEIEKALNLSTKEVKKKLNSSFKKMKAALIV